jgi:hypothetical protein
MSGIPDELASIPFGLGWAISIIGVWVSLWVSSPLPSSIGGDIGRHEGQKHGSDR